MARRIPTPFCHGCRRHFAPGEQFVALADCVFHARCREEFMEIGAELMAKRYPSPEADSLRAQVADLQSRLSKTTADRDAANASLKTVKRQLAAHKNQIETVTNRYNTERATVVMLQRQIAEMPGGVLRSVPEGQPLPAAQAEQMVAALRAGAVERAAAEGRPPAIPPVPVATPSPGPPAEGPADDPAMRFSQIELD